MVTQTSKAKGALQEPWCYKGDPVTPALGMQVGREEPAALGGLMPWFPGAVGVGRPLWHWQMLNSSALCLGLFARILGEAPFSVWGIRL